MSSVLGPIGAALEPVDSPQRLTAPTTHQEAGVSPDLLMRLTLKTLSAAGELTGSELGRRLGVLFGVIEPALEFLKAQHHCEVVAGSMIGPASYRYRITIEGRTVARLFMQQDQYIGPVPVPLSQYTHYMAALQQGSRRTTRASVRDAFSQLVLADDVLDEIGTAVSGGRSVFIYGPPGNGKTMLAMGIQRLLQGDILVPHALEVEGSIIRVFDPVNHQERTADLQDGNRLSMDSFPLDARWALCARPVVRVGGEMTLDSFDLTYHEGLGYYRAPLQVIANGGVLVVDDFGRQRCSPADLLNRWMVPLEGGLDYLMLQSGQKFEVPFQAFVAFATNLNPSALLDEAFLRRVPFKVFAANPSRSMYVRIFAQQCAELGLDFDPTLCEWLLDGFYRARGITPRGCHPRDLIGHALLIAAYRGEPRALTAALLETACLNYFVTDRAPIETAAP